MVDRYKTKQESIPYERQKFFDFMTRKFITILDDTTWDNDTNINNNLVDEDIDLREGVMSESKVSVIENMSFITEVIEEVSLKPLTLKLTLLDLV